MWTPGFVFQLSVCDISRLLNLTYANLTQFYNYRPVLYNLSNYVSANILCEPHLMQRLKQYIISPEPHTVKMLNVTY